MTCTPIVGGYICGGNYRYQQRHGQCHGLCASPEARLVVSLGSPYYDPIVHCVDCGDQWSGGELGTRPFMRGWRKKAVERHERLWALGCECVVDIDKDFYPVPCKTHAAI